MHFFIKAYIYKEFEIDFMVQFCSTWIESCIFDFLWNLSCK